MAQPPSVDLTLGTSTAVRLRLATPDDQAALQAGFAHLSDDSRYQRFFTAMPKLTSAMLGQLTDLDGHNRLAIAAFDPTRASEVGASSDGFGIAVARYVRPRDDTRNAAELALSVIDEYHHLGLGTLLMASLVMAAQRHRIGILAAYTLGNNDGMVHLLQRFGGNEVPLDPPEPATRYFELGVDSALDHAQINPALVRSLEPMFS